MPQNHFSKKKLPAVTYISYEVEHFKIVVIQILFSTNAATIYYKHHSVSKISQ